MLISNAELYDDTVADVRIANGIVSEIGSLTPIDGEQALDARGSVLLPGLNDHHLHFRSLAASMGSVRCGPPAVVDERSLTAALNDASPNAGGWIRGYGYHDSVSGEIDRHWLDAHAPPVPIRIQHRSGRLWIVNSPAMALIAVAGRRMGEPLSPAVRASGRLYDLDHVLHALVASHPLPVAETSRMLASFGVTGFTDMTPGNDAAAAQWFAASQSRGALLQRVLLAGAPGLSATPTGDRCTRGPTKIHLHDSALPPFDQLSAVIAASHAQQRAIAVHCVTETALVFTLAAIREAGPLAGDRIEHASVTPPALLAQLAELGLIVVTQPNFIAERGDAYLEEIPAAEHDWLYRCASLIEGGIPLAGGTDAPFGGADPWHAMHAAVQRHTEGGSVLGANEALTPEQALALFLGELRQPHVSRRIRVGTTADLCLLDNPWIEARTELTSARVRATVCGGRLVYDRVDETPL